MFYTMQVGRKATIYGLFEKIYEMPPIDFWDKSIPLKKIIPNSKTRKQIKNEIKERIKEISGEKPYVMRCGIVANPDDRCFTPIIYAKIINNGTTYGITNVNLCGISEEINFVGNMWGVAWQKKKDIFGWGSKEISSNATTYR